MAPKTQRNANNTAPQHNSPSRLQKMHHHAEENAKNAGSQNAAKARAHAALTPPRRVAQCAASHSRATQTSTDVETSKTAQPTAVLRRRRWSLSRVDGVEDPRSLQNESRRWRKWGAKFGGALRRWRRDRGDGFAPARSARVPMRLAPAKRASGRRTRRPVIARGDSG